MAYNYLGLVNDVCDKFNEVRLTDLTFPTSNSGYYADVKNAVNQAIHRINFEKFEWPFNHVKTTLPLVVNQVEYDYPVTAKHVAFDTFRIKGEDTYNNETTPLEVLDYEEWLKTYGDAEFNPEDYASIPKYVYRGRNLKFGLHPPPDQTYNLVYEYYNLPTDLVLWSDVPSVPEPFRHVIYEGALYHAYLFRGDTEAAALSLQSFEDLIKAMRTIYINRTEYVRTHVVRS